VSVMYTHPYFAVEYIRQHEHDLAVSAARYGPLTTRRKQVRRSLRHRVGWRLVEIGLTLARGSALEVR
jgi:Arc/MetJ family transcription regulator